jgi:hypothetical protein
MTYIFKLCMALRNGMVSTAVVKPGAKKDKNRPRDNGKTDSMLS